MDEMLNVQLVDELRRERGTTVKWMISHLGLSRSSGYLMFRKGLLPESKLMRRKVLESLSTYFGVPVRQILVRPQAKETA